MSEEGKDLDFIDEPAEFDSPSPLQDYNEPLIWSSAKKHLYLTIVAIVAFLPD